MSTIATHLNWGTSYVINDFYKRFIKRDASEKHYVFISRIATLLVMIASVLITLIIKTISGAWQFIIEASAGLGLVLILRWYWWRINAWSEIVAMIAPFFGYAYIKLYTKISFPETLFYIVAFTTLSWLVATFITKPVDKEHLINFYRRVHPGGIGWKKVSQLVPEVKSDPGFIYLFIDWISGVVLVYMMLFGIGKIVLGEYLGGVIYILIGLSAGLVIYFDLSRRGWEKAIE
ncbi:Sodium:solute symporter family protein [Candidatus Kryptobacter tengchongensis]|nr:Sodium:solute symporter family protein [Candidatus Kryptobacter tengchongensis]